ncbi:putative phage abortive infection protein [Prosthecobacter sp.]|uniref:putative phage abortive infection protein n=1 Tax=Prosthecobacter sp. TaxID=1965333 RepID=UPI003785109A
MKSLLKLFTVFILFVMLASPVLPIFAPASWYEKIEGWLPVKEQATEPANLPPVLNPAKAGQFGDFVGGFIGTFIFSLSVVIVTLTYWNQKETNQRTAFESRFFELLKFHRENLAGVEIDGKKGHRAFVSLVREFRMSLSIVRSACFSLDIHYTQRQMIDLAYMAFYYGVGPNSSRILEKSVGKNHPQNLISLVVQKMTTIQEAYSLSKSESELSYFWTMQMAGYERARIHYCPFDGHQSRIAHYYRHLWQMMKYVETHENDVKAQDYAGIVSSQMSNHEQALLCLNSLAAIGSAWIDEGGWFGKKGLLIRYALIKNIPEDFFDPSSELNLKMEFPKICFEYERASKVSDPNRDKVSSAQ